MNETLSRRRIHFGKNISARFTSHLDLFRTWERTFRRAGVKLAYRKGFNPQPRLNIASALPLGYTSQAEILDVWLEDGSGSTDEILTSVKGALPPGLEIIGIKEVDLQEPALQTILEAAEYRVTFLNPVPDLNGRCETLLAANTLPRQWRGKTYDLRPLIRRITQGEVNAQGKQTLTIEVGAQEGATGRPDEVISALGERPEETMIHRTRLVFKS